VGRTEAEIGQRVHVRKMTTGRAGRKGGGGDGDGGAWPSACGELPAAETLGSHGKEDDRHSMFYLFFFELACSICWEYELG
jgi:hypothetical protein